MLRHLISELKEASVCVQAGQVTLGYPFQPHPPEAGFRGKVEVDTSLCIGCGACAAACPARAISIRDDRVYRTIEMSLRRCTYCAQCRDVCPQHAIALTTQFETASPSMDDMSITLELKLVLCRQCGAPVGTERALARVAGAMTEQLGVQREALGWLDLCIPCRRKDALNVIPLAMGVAP
jgi:hydrogenase-4 component H